MHVELDTVLALVQLWQQHSRWGLFLELWGKAANADAEANTARADERLAHKTGICDPDLFKRYGDARRADAAHYRAELAKLRQELSAIEGFCRENCPAAFRILRTQHPVDSPPTDGYDRLAQAMREVEAELRNWDNRTLDKGKKKPPKNYDVQELMKLLDRAKNRGRSKREIAREFTGEPKGQCPQADNLLRQVNRHRPPSN